MSDFLTKGEAERPAWSGYWWPMMDSRDRSDYRNLYDDDGPLNKYDNFCVALGLPNPRSSDFERWRHWADTRMEKAIGAKAFWWGHCNGWAAASVLEPEPRAPRTIKNLYFGVGDLKGLLTVSHNGDPVDIIRKLGHSDAHLFHAMVLQSIGRERRGLIFDTKLDEIDPKTKQAIREVWNYPAYRYECTYTPVGDDQHEVTMQLWFADDGVQPDYVGTKNWPSPNQPKVYTYRITGDQANPIAGSWVGQSVHDHPDLMWRPQPLSVQNRAEELNPGSSQTNFHPALRPLIYAIVDGNEHPPPDAVRQKLASLNLEWVVTKDEAAGYPPPLEVGDWYRYSVAHRDPNGQWTRPFVLHVEVVGWKGDDWVFEVGAVHEKDIIPERHVIYYDKKTRQISDRSPGANGYAYTLHQDKKTGAFKTEKEPSLWENSPLRRLLSQIPYAWERAGHEPVEDTSLKSLGSKPVPSRELPVGLGKQMWADYSVSHPRGNLRGMFLTCSIDNCYAELVDFGHKDNT